jgi:hypothetical protein
MTSVSAGCRKNASGAGSRQDEAQMMKELEF